MAGHSRDEGGRPATLLVVDDEDVVRNVIVRALEATGLRILTAGSAAEALAAAEGLQIDLLVTDLSLPDLSGPALAARMLVADPALRVLYVSGWHDRDAFPEVEDSLLTKPFTFDELRTAIAGALDGHPRPYIE